MYTLQKEEEEVVEGVEWAYYPHVRRTINVGRTCEGHRTLIYLTHLSQGCFRVIQKEQRPLNRELGPFPTLYCPLSQ